MTPTRRSEFDPRIRPHDRAGSVAPARARAEVFTNVRRDCLLIVVSANWGWMDDSNNSAVGSSLLDRSIGTQDCTFTHTPEHDPGSTLEPRAPPRTSRERAADRHSSRSVPRAAP